VSAVNSRLLGKPERPDPVCLAANARFSYLGSKIYGNGFTLTPEQRADLIKKDARNGQLIFPYIGGEEVNTSPTQAFDRYVINFGDRSLEEAEAWPDLIRIVREEVKPERDKLRDNSIGIQRRRFWWRFGSSASSLYESIKGKRRVLVNSRVSKHLVFAWQAPVCVFAESLYVYPVQENLWFAILQSRVHEPWARLLSSSMRNDLRYTASDCFETFPFPRACSMPSLESIGQHLYETRAKFMVDTDQGLTKTYNLLKDSTCTEPRIIELRHLHEEMDRAVLSVYGWDDIQVPPFEEPNSESGRKAREVFKEEVIDRLFALNAERAQEERIHDQ
jgi:hypothetical protein